MVLNERFHFERLFNEKLILVNLYMWLLLTLFILPKSSILLILIKKERFFDRITADILSAVNEYPGLLTRNKYS